METTEGAPIVTADALSQKYRYKAGLFSKSGIVRAMSDVSFTLRRGRTLAVIGESGCGKSTLARVVAMIEKPASGSLVVCGKAATPGNWAALRCDVQIVFQDPFGTLNPRQRVDAILQEPLKINRRSLSAAERRRRVREMLQAVELHPDDHLNRFPHMLSGGQRQRIAIARALMLDPKVLVLDEPVSALDVSVQGHILNLLLKLQSDRKLAYLFISHDLSVVRHMADDILVMYLGLTVEKGTREDVLQRPKHPYTRALIAATPVADPRARRERIRLEGELPSPMNVPRGCPFQPRCWKDEAKTDEKCRLKRPTLDAEPHQVRCPFPLPAGWSPGDDASD